MEPRSYGMLVVAGIVALGAVGIAIVTTNLNSDDTSGAPLAVVGGEGTSVSGDADEDGVPDWKEILWGTDPHNPDTYGQGLGDAEEIMRQQSETRSGENPVGYIAPSALPPSEAAGRELFAGYTAALQSGGVSQAEISAVVSEVIERNTVSLGEAPVYTLGDFVHTTQVSKDAYAPALLAAMKKMTAVKEYELSTFGRIIEFNNVSGFEKLQGAATVYRETTDAVLALSVPESVAPEHLAVINALSLLAHATDGLSKWSGDPLEAMARVDAFATAETEFAGAVSKLYSRIY